MGAKSFAFGATLFVALALFLFSRPTESERIRSLLAQVEVDVNRIPSLPFFEQLALVKKYISELSDFVEIELTNGGRLERYSISRKEAQDKAMAAVKSSFRKLEARFNHGTITVRDHRATCELEVTVLGALSGVDGDFFEDWQVIISLSTQSDGWKIERIQGYNLRTD
ncbi:MAG: hypothetical protein U0136_21810 [Bdellovibrionota bacterium]